jgi:hypothetical protein
MSAPLPSAGVVGPPMSDVAATATESLPRRDPPLCESALAAVIGSFEPTVFTPLADARRPAGLPEG